MHLFYPISLYYLHVEPRLGLSAPKKAQREVPCAVCAPTPGCARNCRNASPTHPARRRVTRDPCPQLLPNVASRTPLLRRVSGHWACARAVPGAFPPPTRPPTAVHMAKIVHQISRLLARFGASGKSTWSGWGCSLRAFMRHTSTGWLRRSAGGDLASCPPGPARARCWPPPPCRNFCSAATFSGLRRCPQRAQKS